ncbi:DUF736 family protein [Bradyrhizobium sp. 24]|nr:DUF736 family protein [Bradyrhizobium sp. 37]MCK1377947.1 DUF736 family protein [Bradyrhizobium sp. 24]MCK1774202.1 DUF736 family protein [Bradyrhizobium sp. 134]
MGTFTSTENGFTGSIRTLTLNVKLVRFENAPSTGPHFRVYSGAVELELSPNFGDGRSRSGGRLWADGRSAWR